MSEKYKSPKSYPVPKTSGYPNKIPSTQTKKMKGTGAATKGIKYSKNSN